MPGIAKSNVEKSTIVRSNYCRISLAGCRLDARAEPPFPLVRDARRQTADRTTAQPRLRQASIPRIRFESLVVLAFKTVVACYAAAVIVRVVTVYGI